MSEERPVFHIDEADADSIKRGRQNMIRRALAAGVPDDVIVRRIMVESAVGEVVARQVLAWEKGENPDDVLPPRTAYGAS